MILAFAIVGWLCFLICFGLLWRVVWYRSSLYDAETDRSSKHLGAGHYLVGGPGGYVVIDVDGPQG